MKNKKVLVTGGSGFIASHLVKRLLALGASVTITTRYNSVIDNIRLKNVWDDINVIECDLRDTDSLKIAELKPEIIFHLAAYNHVGESFTHVSEVFDVNAKGTANLMEAYEGYEKFVYMSTSEVYGYQKSVPFTESMNPNPISPYSITKYAGELYARMKKRMGKPVIVLRCFNTYGPYQSVKAIIPEIILNCLKNKPIKATKGKQTREFNYIDDIIDALILAITVPNASKPEVINVGCNKDISIRKLIEMIARLTGSESKLNFGALQYRPIEIWNMKAANFLAKEYLNWYPKHTLAQGLTNTIEWYKKYENRDIG
jgi:UDP-glucose 4-epimerase